MLCIKGETIWGFQVGREHLHFFVLTNVEITGMLCPIGHQGKNSQDEIFVSELEIVTLLGEDAAAPSPSLCPNPWNEISCWGHGEGGANAFRNQLQRTQKNVAIISHLCNDLGIYKALGSLHGSYPGKSTRPIL